MNREKEREGAMRVKSGWRKRKREESRGDHLGLISVFFSLLSPSSRLDLWWVCVCVRACIRGMCFHTEDIPRRALSIHQHSVCPLTDPDSCTPHECVRECVCDCVCVRMFECVCVDVRHWSSEWDSECMCLHVSCHVQVCKCVSVCVYVSERETEGFCGRDS